MFTNPRMRILGMGLLLVATAAMAAAPAITVEHAQAIMTTPTFGAAYATVKASSNDTLTGVSSTCCDAVEIHKSSFEHGVMRMRHLDAVPISANQPIIFEPHAQATSDDSMHIMLIGAKKPFKPGDRFDITLHFAKAGTQPQHFTVAKPNKK